MTNEKTILTPYAASKLVNAELEKANLKTIPPQMMYNYTTAKVNAGKNPLIKYTNEGGVDETDLKRWTKAYIEKKTAPVTENTKETTNSK